MIDRVAEPAEAAALYSSEVCSKRVQWPGTSEWCLRDRVVVFLAMVSVLAEQMDCG